MKKINIMLCLLFLGVTQISAQKYFTRNGEVTFHSEMPIERIDAKNTNATCVLDIESGDLEFAVLIKGFHFEKALMQEHFNENYLESDIYPKSKFKGKIENIATLNIVKDGIYPLLISGDLTIHGVTHSIETKGEIIIEKGVVLASTQLKILVKDYNIVIPKIVASKIAKEVEVRVEMLLNEFKR